MSKNMHKPDKVRSPCDPNDAAMLTIFRYLLKRLDDLVCQMLGPRRPALEWQFHFGDTSFSIQTQGNFHMRVPIGFYVLALVTAVTASGAPAQIDGEVTLTSSDPSVVEVVGNKLVARGPGVAQIKAQADADLGEGVRLITSTGAIEVPDEAVGLELKFSPPEPFEEAPIES